MSKIVDYMRGVATEEEIEPVETGEKVVYKMPEGITVEIVMVTPKMALEWLEKNHISQRIMRDHTMFQYASEIESDSWYFNGDTIVFDTEQDMVNGQHRLCAIVYTGIAIPCLIVTGVSLKARPTIDTGKKRNLTETTGFEAYVCRVLQSLCPQKARQLGLTADSAAVVYTEFKEGVDFVIANLWYPTAQRVSNATTAGALVRAYYVYTTASERARLLSFIEVLKSGVPVESYATDGAAVKLRDFLIFESRRHQDPAVISKIENAIRQFVARKCESRLMPLKARLFPLDVAKVLKDRKVHSHFSSEEKYDIRCVLNEWRKEQKQKKLVSKTTE